MKRTDSWVFEGSSLLSGPASPRQRVGRRWVQVAVGTLCLATVAFGKDDPEVTAQFYNQAIQPLTQQYCFKCHSALKHKGDMNLEQFTSFDLVKKHPEVWQRVIEELRDAEMPPDDARQPSDEELARLQSWAHSVLDTIALEQAGDPGPVVLRRLSNAEYTYTVEDLTGIESLDPVKEFPEDGAAGEGFTNTGQALAMSPTLVSKYLDAAKDVASHAVLLPNGIHFSDKSNRLEWSNELVRKIRDFYRKFADVPPDRLNFEGDKRQLGSVSGPSENGQLPLEKYLAATLEERGALSTGEKTPADVAQERQLNSKYFTILWKVLTSNESSRLLDDIRARWRIARPEDAASLAEDISKWQSQLCKFQSIGNLNNDGNPKMWMESVTPLAEKEELKVPLWPSASGDEIVVYMACGDAGEGKTGNLMEWQQPRLTRPGRPTILLRDARGFVRQLTVQREQIFSATSRYLAAAAEVSTAGNDVDFAALARRRKLDTAALQVWLNYLGIGASPSPKLDLYTNKLINVTPWNYIQGWGSLYAPGVAANSSDDDRVRIPAIMWPHNVVLAPSATEYSAVSWRSPIKGTVRIEATVTHENPSDISAYKSANGSTWSLQLRHGRFRKRLAGGAIHLLAEIREYSPGVVVGPFENISVEPGDLISLLIGSRDGNELSDETGVKLRIVTEGQKSEEWSLTRDVSSNVLAGNPHADSAGRPGIWNFYAEPIGGTEGLRGIPPGSLISRWLAARSAEEKAHLAAQVQQLLTSTPPAASHSADAATYRYLTSLGGPFFAAIQPKAPFPSDAEDKWGLDPAIFGRHANVPITDSANLVVEAPSLIEVHLPAELFAGAELEATAHILHPSGSAAGLVQANLLASKPTLLTAIKPEWPILANKSSSAWEAIDRSCAEFNRVFPAALCYTKIIPSDSAGTMIMFYRDDQPLIDLMLSNKQKAQIDRLWDDLHYVNQDALMIADNCSSARDEAKKPQFVFPEWPRTRLGPVTTGLDPKPDYDRICRTANGRADALRQELIDSQPRQLNAVLDFADRAFRRPLTAKEKEDLQGTYYKLRKLNLPHEDAIRLTLASVLIEPAFLYRSEKPGPGPRPLPISQTELASRLSYFLWSSAPDAELRSVAAAGRLNDPNVLAAQTRRMLRDPRMRHLSIEFGCEWLKIHDFDEVDGKSALSFPTFAALQGDMLEETVLYFTDLFQNNRSVLNLLDSDYTFLNEALAKHYGIPGVVGPEWRKVDGIQKYSRGGILAQASFLAERSSASRTSPILRGSWIADVLLGTKLPKPPTNVPQLPEDEATQKMTIRQLVDRHVSDPRCSGCHARFDAYGFALENFDAIGRFRSKDMGNRPIVTEAKLSDGTALQGFDSLRQYLLTQRRSDFVHQFCRKLLGYALGRSVQLSDEPLIKEMEEQLAANHYEVDTAINLIVCSRQFCDIRGRDYVSND